MKTCPKCGIEKERGDYYADKRRLDGLASWCKCCSRIATRRWQAEHQTQYREYNKQWRERNIEYDNERSRKWKADNKEHVKEYVKQSAPHRAVTGKAYYEANKATILEGGKKWRAANVEKTRATGRKAANKRMGTTKGRLSNAMTCRMREVLKGNKANRHWEELVDYTIDQLKMHLEKLFTPEMNWENYGSVWEIDHKIPISVHNFERPEDLDFRLCWSLKNLQPLGRLKNRSKSNKIDKPFQPALAIAV